MMLPKKNVREMIVEADIVHDVARKYTYAAVLMTAEVKWQYYLPYLYSTQGPKT